MEEILRQEYIVTNEFNEEMALASLKRQLSSAIFTKLINEEKFGIKLTFVLEVLEDKL